MFYYENNSDFMNLLKEQGHRDPRSLWTTLWETLFKKTEN